MVLGEFDSLVCHIVRTEDNEPCTLCHKAFAKLRHGSARSVCSVGSIYIDHLGSRHFLEHILNSLIVSLTPSMVVVRANHDQTDS